MLSTISPYRTVRRTKDGTQDQDWWESGKREDFELEPGSLVEGNNLRDGYTQSYIYVHIIEYGEREAASPQQENARSPASYAREYAQARTRHRVFTSTHSHTRIHISIDSIEINTQD